MTNRTTYREEVEELNDRLEKVKENGIKEEEKIYHQNDQWGNFSSTAHNEEAVPKGNQLEQLEFVRHTTFRTKGAGIIGNNFVFQNGLHSSQRLNSLEKTTFKTKGILLVGIL